MGQNRPHALTLSLLFGYLAAIFGLRRVQSQATLEITGSDGLTNRPEPDLVALSEDTATNPTGEQVLLAIEVCATTQDDDFGRKVGLYARAGIAEYWVVDLPRRVIVVFRQPQGGVWLERREFVEADQIACLAAPTHVSRVADLMA